MSRPRVEPEETGGAATTAVDPHGRRGPLSSTDTGGAATTAVDPHGRRGPLSSTDTGGAARTRHWTLAQRADGRSLCSSSSEATTKQFEPSDKRRLLDIARRAIEAAVGRGPQPEPNGSAPSPAIAQPAAAFVTLHERGALRGCIGLMRYDVPLWINVRDAAVAAALDDPRFLPVTESEVPALEMEVSVLEPPVELPDPAGFEAGRHGIVVERGMRRALLLPQVATEMGWGAEQMLDAVCRKAGLPGTAWRDTETRLFVFESSCFNERELAGSADGSATA